MSPLYKSIEATLDFHIRNALGDEMDVKAEAAKAVSLDASLSEEELEIIELLRNKLHQLALIEGARFQ
jgi:hypothetical protein